VDVAAAGASYTYDPNGNLATKAEGTDTWGYEWNAENELTRVTKNSVEVARFAYDPDGRRVEKVAGGVATAYTYDAEDVVREIRGTTTLKYVHGPGFDEPLAADDGSAPSYFQPDALGSIVKVTNAAGAVTLTRQYDAWGDLEVGVGEPGYAFTGREWDPETRLFHYRARYFDPKIGRFTSEDPIGFKGGRNFYAYVNNDPARRVDPLGLLGDPYTTACTVTFGGYAWRQGKRWGWPYAHCVASCLIARYCGQAASYTSGEAKEYWDWAWCKTGRKDSCDSAFQPSDYQDNFTGATCPIQITCEQACAHRKNQNPPPGPHGGEGWR
jgi:RHS repeat-associated protein